MQGYTLLVDNSKLRSARFGRGSPRALVFLLADQAIKRAASFTECHGLLRVLDFEHLDCDTRYRRALSCRRPLTFRVFIVSLSYIEPNSAAAKTPREISWRALIEAGKFHPDLQAAILLEEVWHSHRDWWSKRAHI